VIAEIVTYAGYVAFSERLRLAHFTEDEELNCRWHNENLMLDVLALNKEVLSFTNIWYESALRHASVLSLPGGASIRVITAPFFLATKMEAFRGRAKMDYQESTIWKILLRWSKDAKTWFKKSRKRRRQFGIIWLKRRRTCWRNRASLMCCRVLFWMMSASH